MRNNRLPELNGRHFIGREGDDMTTPLEPERLIGHETKERLTVRLFNLVEGEAEGRWAITTVVRYRHRRVSHLAVFVSDKASFSSRIFCVSSVVMGVFSFLILG
jgi:hypothetical protein